MTHPTQVQPPRSAASHRLHILATASLSGAYGVEAGLYNNKPAYLRHQRRNYTWDHMQLHLLQLLQEEHHGTTTTTA